MPKKNHRPVKKSGSKKLADKSVKKLSKQNLKGRSYAKASRKNTVKAAGKNHKKNILDLVLPDFAGYFLIFAIIGVLLLFLWVISPFFNVLIYSALIAIVFMPLYRFVLRFLGGRESLSAFLCTILVVLICLAPLTVFMGFLAQEAVDAYAFLEDEIEETNFTAIENIDDLPWIGETISGLSEKYRFEEYLSRLDFNLFEFVRNIGESVTAFIFNQSANIVKSLGDTVISIFILLLTLFFFFRDGKDVAAFLKNVSPLPRKHEDEIEKKLKGTTYAIVVGNFGTALLQGVAGAVGFWIAGVEHVLLWGTVMSFASLIPYVGASVVWFPVAVFFLLQGNFAWGVFLVLWGLIVVSAVDNVARPYLIGSTSKMHPLATFLVVLGGIYVFGLKGIIFGPLILSLTVTIIHIYQLEYRELLKD